MASELWSAFRGIAGLPLVERRFVVQTEDIIRQMRSGGCRADAEIELITDLCPRAEMG